MTALNVLVVALRIEEDQHPRAANLRVARPQKVVGAGQDRRRVVEGVLAVLRGRVRIHSNQDGLARGHIRHAHNLLKIPRPVGRRYSI